MCLDVHAAVGQSPACQHRPAGSSVQPSRRHGARLRGSPPVWGLAGADVLTSCDVRGEKNLRPELSWAQLVAL